VLDSALVELGEVGHAGFTMARVAQRAGVHETTVYRRWPKREDLIVDAFMQLTDAELPVPNTGSLAGDLRIVLTNLARLFETPIGQSMVSIGFSARMIPDFSASSVALVKARIEIGQQVFAHAIARGEWPSGYDELAVFTELVGPLLARYFLLHEAITPEVIDARIEAVLAHSTSR